MTERADPEVETPDHPHPDAPTAPRRTEANNDAEGRGGAHAKAEPR
jgi:hypothetical protein